MQPALFARVGQTVRKRCASNSGRAWVTILMSRGEREPWRLYAHNHARCVSHNLLGDGTEPRASDCSMAMSAHDNQTGFEFVGDVKYPIGGRTDCDQPFEARCV